jgi:hypothetical protein
MNDDLLASTRRALHGVAELLIAGPQYRIQGTIRLRVTPGGFGGTVSEVCVDGIDLVHAIRREPLTGTARQVAVALGIDAGPPEGLYTDGSGVGEDDPLVVDAAAAASIASWFATGDAALRDAFDAAAEPVLWPEHFDLAVVVDEVTYGVSPGDSAWPRPYAYVAPWRRRSGAFWNAPFGAGRDAAELDEVAAMTDFFLAGRAAAS